MTSFSSPFFRIWVSLFTFGILGTCAPPPATLSRTEYAEKLEGFWLGQCIANWTGLVTEMDKIGNVGEIKTGAFYTRADWGKPDQPSIWGEGVPSELSPTIDFVFAEPDSVWGSDDDTDIEYIYHSLLVKSPDPILTAEQIREGWQRHILPEEENYLWVANQRAFDLMNEGMLPPATGDPAHNEHYAMIDAQLTTEIFGLYAPLHPEVALRLAALPIQTVARHEAEDIARFYVVLHALAAGVDPRDELHPQLMVMAATARQYLPDGEYPAKMYDYVRAKYEAGLPWEATRDSIYQRYQVEQADGYGITARGLYCNGCFAAGINYAASLISYFYGAGDLRETIRIGTLCGWDSDNPTATWGGLLGFIYGKEGVEKAFGRDFSDRYWIHRTRRGFPDGGVDSFPAMARRGVEITDRVVTRLIGGEIREGEWVLP
jgi:hypothetical protein